MMQENNLLNRKSTNDIQGVMSTYAYATITQCDLSPRFFCIDATLLYKFEIDKI